MLFKPNTLGYLDAIRGQRQKDNQFANKYIEQIKEIGFNFCSGLPETDEQLNAIIETMSPKFHQPFVRGQLDIARNAMSRTSALHPLSFRDLEMWAAASDAAYANHAHYHKSAVKNAGKARPVQAETDAGTKDKKKWKKGRAAFAQVFEEVSPNAFVFQVQDQEPEGSES